MRDENGAVEDCGPATVAPGDQVFSLTPVADTEFAELKMIDPP
jgi:hypothetical protein